MDKKDETIVCKDCGNEFTFTVRDQEFYEEKGFANKPVRCRDCRNARKQSRDSRPRFNNDDRRNA